MNNEASNYEPKCVGSIYKYIKYVTKCCYLNNTEHALKEFNKYVQNKQNNELLFFLSHSSELLVYGMIY